MAENFMTEHSKIRKKRNTQPIYNGTTINLNISHSMNFVTENIGKAQKNDEVYYNFDKEKFIGNLNGMTKFFVALGSLDSRLVVGNIESRKELHYVHIPRFVRTGENFLKLNSAESLRKGLNFDLEELNYGDTFYLESNWIILQQSELLSKNIKTEKKFINGIINTNKDKNFKKDEKEKLIKQSSVITFNENKTTEKKDENDGKIVRYLVDTSNIVFPSNTDADTESLRIGPSVCVKYMGTLGGHWPTPQVNILPPNYFFYCIVLFVLFGHLLI
jgi:hypothetical protein